MLFHPVHTENDIYLPFVQELYESTFPLHERRHFEELPSLLSGKSMHLEVILTDESLPAGFVIYWVLDNFLFIEHLAIAPEQRNKGLGGEIVQHLIADTGLNCLLEVEPPIDLSGEKRIRFYQQLGFAQTPVQYHQPPYHKGFLPVPMLLLARPVPSPDILCSYIKQLHYAVYQYDKAIFFLKAFLNAPTSGMPGEKVQ